MSNKTEWYVKVTNNNQCLIKVKFLPKEYSLVFIGEYKVNGRYTDIYEYQTSPEISLEGIQDALFLVYTETMKRIEKLNDFNNSFKFITEIEINE